MRLIDWSYRCFRGRHDHPVADRALDGRRVLRCQRCWGIVEYPETDPGKVEALRAEQQRQAAQIAVKRQWRATVALAPVLPVDRVTR